MNYPLIRVRTENGWEVWTNVKEISISYPRRVPFTWHTDEHHKIVVDEWITIPAALPTVTTMDSIDIPVFEVEVMGE